jgi:hypothetical protein
MSSCNLIDLFPSQSPLSNLGLVRVFSFCLLPISQSEIPAAFSFLILLFLFPPPLASS